MTDAGTMAPVAANPSCRVRSRRARVHGSCLGGPARCSALRALAGLVRVEFRDAVEFAYLAQHRGGELTAAEVRYLMRHEFAETADDVLWRRSKLGLHLDAGAQAGLARFMENGDGRAAAE